MTTGAEDESPPPEPTFADVMNGFSFDSSRSSRSRRWGRRRRNQRAEAKDTDQPASPAAPWTPPAGYGAPEEYSGYSGDSYPAEGYRVESSYPPAPGYPEGGYDSQGYPEGQAGGHDGHNHADGSGFADEPEDEPEIEGAAAVVRPYAWTRGRTKSGLNLEIETLISTSQRGRDQLGVLQYEHRSVAELCDQTRSVAEVAALLSVPLGVAKVLVGDMAGLGLVVVHQTVSGNGDAPDFALMERVLSGLRRL